MTTPSDIDAVEARLMENERDIVAMVRPNKLEAWQPATRAWAECVPANVIRKVLASHLLLVKEPFTTKDGVRFTC